MKKYLFFKNGWNFPNKYFDFFSLHDLQFKNSFNFDLRDILVNGLNGIDFYRQLLTADGVNKLFLERDQRYLKLCQNLIQYSDSYDSIVMFDFNFLHPEIIKKYFSGKKMILAFVDDPYSTLSRGVPYLSAFDASIFISPTYLANSSTEKLLTTNNDKPVRWFPLVNPGIQRLPIEDLLRNKSEKIFYAGAPTFQKYQNLTDLKRVLKSDFNLYGKWPMYGYYGYVAPLLKKSLFPRRVKSITNLELLAEYKNCIAAANMHCSGINNESGNLRTYEIAAYACVSLNFQSKENEKIFPTESGLYVSSVDEAAKSWSEIKAHPNQFKEMAAKRYDYFWQHYSPEKVYCGLYDWISEL